MANQDPDSHAAIDPFEELRAAMVTAYGEPDLKPLSAAHGHALR